MRLLIISILIFFVSSPLTFAQKERKDFVIEITYVDWLRQPFVKYTLNKTHLIVQTSSYEDFKIIKSTLYKRKISKSVSDSIYSFLSSFKVDTSKANCNNPVLDGLYKTYFFEGYGLGQTLIKNYSCITTSAAKLQSLIDGQLKKKKYKYQNLKQSE